MPRFTAPHFEKRNQIGARDRGNLWGEFDSRPQLPHLPRYLVHVASQDLLGPSGAKGKDSVGGAE